jgi:hypothetical protein
MEAWAVKWFWRYFEGQSVFKVANAATSSLTLHSLLWHGTDGGKDEMEFLVLDQKREIYLPGEAQFGVHQSGSPINRVFWISTPLLADSLEIETFLEPNFS